VLTLLLFLDWFRHHPHHQRVGVVFHVLKKLAWITAELSRLPDYLPLSLLPPLSVDLAGTLFPLLAPIAHRARAERDLAHLSIPQLLFTLASIPLLVFAPLPPLPVILRILLALLVLLPLFFLLSVSVVDLALPNAVVLDTVPLR